jgi:hypothetical protein
MTAGPADAWSRNAPSHRAIETSGPALQSKGPNSMKRLPRDLCRQEFGEQVIIIGL